MFASPDTDKPASLFPVALHIAGRRCVVVGGGAVAERKVRALLECEANVVVVAPDVPSVFLRDGSQAGVFRHVSAFFSAVHLTGAFLCVAATDNAAVNEAVLLAAREQNVLCNLAGVSFVDKEVDAEKNANKTETGDFSTMAAVRRGDLLLAVTTGGAGPAVSARIKRDWDADFGPEWETYTHLLREMRGFVNGRGDLSETVRTLALRRLAANDSIREMLARGDEAGAKAEALAAVRTVLETENSCR